MNEKNESIPVILNINLVISDSSGVKAKDLHNGDVVYSLITDTRDIGQYLARLLGGKTKDGVVPLPTEIEEVSYEEETVKLRVHFTPGIIGLAKLNPDLLVKTKLREREKFSSIRQFILVWRQRILDFLLRREETKTDESGGKEKW